MRSATLSLLLPVFGLFSALCPSVHAAPQAEARPEIVPVPVGATLDLLVRVDPAGTPVRRESIAVEVTAPEGASVEGAAVLPPAPEGGAWDEPFTVRVPFKIAAPEPFGGDPFDDAGGLGGGAGDLRFGVVVKGTAGDGDAFSAETSTKILPNEEPKGHVELRSTRLEEEPVHGKRNAVVVELVVREKGYWVYGEKEPAPGEVAGAPLTVELLRAPSAADEPEWSGGWPVSPPGAKYVEGEPFTVSVPFVPLVEGELTFRALVRWEACNEKICDPAEAAYITQTIEVAQGDGTVDTLARTEKTSGLGDKSLWTLIVAAIGAALFALVMPCTYPMIPITISFFTKQAEQRDGNVLGLALVYGLGIIAIFIVIGVLVGGPIVQFAGLWWVNLLFALLFLVFGLSLIGLFEIRLPAWFNNLAASAGGSGGYFSVFAMGTTLVITSFTCTAPFVGTLLVYAGEAGSLLRVALAMGVFGLTMAIPFVFLSLSPRALHALPRSGMWMKTLKVTLGIVELGLVLKFLSNIDIAVGTYWIPRRPFILLWGLSFFVAALYLLDVTGLVKRSATWAAGRGRVLSAVVLLAFTGYLWSGLDGGRLAKQLEAFFPPFGEKSYNEAFLAVVKEDYKKGLAEAQERGAPAFVHFTGFQ